MSLTRSLTRGSGPKGSCGGKAQRFSRVRWETRICRTSWTAEQVTPLFESSSAFVLLEQLLHSIGCSSVGGCWKTFLNKPLDSCEGAVAPVGACRAVDLHLRAKLALASFAHSIGLRSIEASHKDSTVIHIKAVLREKDVLTKQTNQSQIKTGYVQ